MAILEIGRDSHYSVGARRTSSLYLSVGDARGANKANVGPSLLDRIEEALGRAGGDPERASEISGIAAGEIARIQSLKAWARDGVIEEVREVRKATASARKGVPQSPVTDADVAKLVGGVATFGSYLRAGAALGWTEGRVWRVHGRGLRTGAIARKRGGR